MYIESLTYDIPPHQLSWFLSTFLLPRSIHFRRTSSLIFFFFVFFHIYESIYCDATLLLCGSGWRKTNKIKTAGCILKHSMVTSKDCYRDCLSDKEWFCSAYIQNGIDIPPTSTSYFAYFLIPISIPNPSTATPFERLISCSHSLLSSYHQRHSTFHESNRMSEYVYVCVCLSKDFYLYWNLIRSFLLMLLVVPIRSRLLWFMRGSSAFLCGKTRSTWKSFQNKF